MDRTVEETLVDAIECALREQIQYGCIRNGVGSKMRAALALAKDKNAPRDELSVLRQENAILRERCETAVLHLTQVLLRPHPVTHV